MQKEHIHIVFGRAARRTLIDSQVVDENISQIVCLKDVLNIGPVCDLNANEDVQKRIEWLKRVYEDAPIPTVQEDLKNIDAILENAEYTKAVYIWTGEDVSEIIGTARLIAHVSTLDIPVSIARFDIPVKSAQGYMVYPKALNQTATFQVKDFFERFECLDKSRFPGWKNLWERVKSENGLLWIRDDDGQIVVKSPDYFDSFLLAHCSEHFEKAARVIGETLVDANFNVDDSYLNWRLKKMAQNGEIEFQGTLNEIRDYEVKKTVHQR